MTISVIKFLHPNQVCVCCPARWDDKRQRVVTWHCLRVVDNLDAARAFLARFDQEDVSKTVAIATTEQIVIEGDLAARFFRVYYGMQ